MHNLKMKISTTPAITFVVSLLMLNIKSDRVLKGVSNTFKSYTNILLHKQRLSLPTKIGLLLFLLFFVSLYIEIEAQISKAFKSISPLKILCVSPIWCYNTLFKMLDIVLILYDKLT